MFDLYNKIFGRLEADEADENYDLDYLEDSEFEEEAPREETPPSNFFNRFTAKPKAERVENAPRPQSRILDMRTGMSPNYDQEVVIMVPYDFEMTKVVCDHVRNGKTVICNIERIDDTTAQRVLDFILGATYALSGSLESISDKIFVVTPASTRLSVRPEERRRPNRPVERANNSTPMPGRRDQRPFPRFTPAPSFNENKGQTGPYFAEEVLAANQ
ncbi:MAG: cell division protein SepF [Eubacteriales bacterium]|nr:cell division protein SepF [Eubacteriales bacterium]